MYNQHIHRKYKPNYFPLIQTKKSGRKCGRSGKGNNEIGFNPSNIKKLKYVHACI